MKLDTRQNTVQSGGVIGDNSDFSIAINAKMFRVLSDTMYQDKIGSMVRELSCNAMDAHIEAGKGDEAFTIHVPDSIEPWFSVKDEGIGMDDATLRKVYTTYGESTKDDSNDVVGAFGLGSKTPFAYTDQFTVTSVYEGVQRIYVAVMNDEGLPVLKLQAENETTDHNGLEVYVAVRDGDYDSFTSALKKQLRFFKVKPTLLNNRYGIEFDKLDETDEIVIDMDGIRVYSGNRYAPLRNGIWITQGGVGYPLDMGKMGDMDASVKEFADALQEKGAILEFEIGQIEVTASREGISYTEAVCKRIVSRLRDSAKVVCDEAMTKIRQENSIWIRVTLYNDQLDVVQKAIRNVDDYEKLFAGTETDRYHRMCVSVDALEALGFKAVYMEKYTSQPRGYSYRHTGGTVKLIRKTVTSSDTSYYDSIKLYPIVNLNVFIRDTNNKPMARLNHFAAENDYPKILVIEGVQGELDAKTIADIAKSLAMPVTSIRKLSELVAPKSESGGRSNDRRPRAFKYSLGANTYNSREWEAICDDIDDIGPAVYIQMDRHDISWSGNAKLVLEAAKNDKLGHTLIAVNRQTYSRIQKGKIGDDLITIEDAAKPLLAQIERVKPMFRALAKYNGFMAKVRQQSILQRLLDSGNMEGLKGIKAVKARQQQLDTRLEGYGFVQQFTQDDLQPIRVTGEEAAQARLTDIMDKYPMLKHLNGHGGSDDELTDAIEYIKLVEKRG